MQRQIPKFTARILNCSIKSFYVSLTNAAYTKMKWLLTSKAWPLKTTPAAHWNHSSGIICWCCTWTHQGCPAADHCSRIALVVWCPAAISDLPAAPNCHLSRDKQTGWDFPPPPSSSLQKWVKPTGRISLSCLFLQFLKSIFSSVHKSALMNTLSWCPELKWWNSVLCPINVLTVHFNLQTRCCG